MIIKHQDIINSILEKKVKDRKKWEHEFLIKYKHQGNVRNYFLSMGEFKDVKIGCGKELGNCKCGEPCEICEGEAHLCQECVKKGLEE